MISGRVTFTLRQQGVPSWQLNELKKLCEMFRSVVIWNNITRGKNANLEKTLAIMSVQNCQNDLCQLAIEGLDAELACMVITEYISQHFLLISTTHNSKKLAEYTLSQQEHLNAPIAVNWHYLESQSLLSKIDVLALAAKSISPKNQHQLLCALEKRENLSSTYLGEGLALPHIMHETVKTVTIAFMHLEKGTTWTLDKPDVNTVLVILIPNTKQRDILLPVTRLTRWLLSASNQRLLADNFDPFTLKIIISHIFRCYQPEC
ncbi:PTS sugar transporter subunit IIA [Vibrio sonorensis]|uniref:PTS sugar transporter subunit IIA n=1 Tax=Vibrio sonorensis TaxID=1004316 RepID=UPI0008D97723|nr:PTS sugar transporter subunit IIA [Vibrio sonorensis]